MLHAAEQINLIRLASLRQKRFCFMSLWGWENRVDLCVAFNLMQDQSSPIRTYQPQR